MRVSAIHVSVAWCAFLRRYMFYKVVFKTTPSTILMIYMCEFVALFIK